MNVTTKNLTITIEDDEEIVIRTRENRHFSMLTDGPISACNRGFAIYAFRGNRQLRRVGGATCQYPASGYSSAMAGSTVMVNTAISSALKVVDGMAGDIEELRIAVCCPPPLTISFVKEKEGKSGSKSRSKKTAARKSGKKKPARKSRKK